MDQLRVEFKIRTFINSTVSIIKVLVTFLSRVNVICESFVVFFVIRRGCYYYYAFGRWKFKNNNNKKNKTRNQHTHTDKLRKQIQQRNIIIVYYMSVVSIEYI